MTNKSITATEAKNRFGDLVEYARQEPITITRNERAVAVVVSPEEYKRLSASDDAYWGQQAKNLDRKNFLSANASQEILSSILNAPDTTA